MIADLVIALSLTAAGTVVLLLLGYWYQTKDW